MDRQDYERIDEITKKQETLLKFEHFSNRDAWELGKFLVQRIYDRNIDLAVAIRRPDGNIIFQYATEGTNLENENWMRRKFNTVSLLKRCSLGAWANSFLTGETVEAQGLSEADYVFCGGGFPICLKTGELAAVLTVSNLPHEQDHEFIAGALEDWLNAEGVPHL